MIIINTYLHTAINKASWVLCPEELAAPIIRRHFQVDTETSAEIAISSLGFFKLYINGKVVGDDFFRPSNSLFRERDSESWLYPLNDTFTYRCYYSIIDITPYLCSGENLLEIKLGDGWYRQTERIAEGNMEFGKQLGAIYAIALTNGCEKTLILSDGTEVCSSSATVYSQLFRGEIYDMRLESESSHIQKPMEVTELPDTLLTPEDSPPDKIIRRIQPVLLSDNGSRRIYDAGENISGLVSLRVFGAFGEEVHIRFAENLHNGELSFDTTGSDYINRSGNHQIMEDVCICDGNDRTFIPQFVWHAFRYFEVVGHGEPVDVAVIHSDTAVTSSFTSSSPELNWLYNAYLRTQLNNMHGGVPSDCPHRERLGYTGDGQVCARAAMTMLDSQAFYRKWIRDIFDSQDKNTGHVNHTAPFAGGGGGPGGWGCAAVIVPYQYYKTYGDTSLLYEYYEQMMKWIDYLLSRTENGLVVREEDGGWCLGDWCTLDETKLPEHFVNTCYLIKTLKYMEEIADVIGNTKDIPKLSATRIMAEKSVKSEFYNSSTGSFADGIQGADAFAIWAGIGDDRTISALVKKYSDLGYFDTGFLGTAILCGLLFENGAENLAYTLLTSHEKGSFGYMMDRGATTIWEQWNGGSHDHPMFGASSEYLFRSILGIGQKDNSAGYRELVIAPKTPDGLSFAKGSVKLPVGEISVDWQKTAQTVQFTLNLPEHCSCDFVYAGNCVRLLGGKHIITEPLTN